MPYMSPIISPSGVSTLTPQHLALCPEICVMQRGMVTACILSINSMGDANTRAMRLSADSLTYEPKWLMGTDRQAFFVDPMPVLERVQENKGAIVTLMADGKHRLAVIGAPGNNVNTHRWMQKFATAPRVKA